jgi:exopolysaccharide biosynthesis polyprenyl glycosylphosphotransferase
MSVLDVVRAEKIARRRALAAPLRSWPRTYVRTLVAADAMVAAVAGILALSVRFGDAPTHSAYVLASLLLPVPWLVVMAMARAYEQRYLGVGSEEFRRVVTGAVWLTAVVGTVSWATKAEVARGYVVIAIPVSCALTLLGRYAARKGLHRLRSAGACMHETIVVGHPHPVAELVRQSRRETYHGLRVIGACLPEAGPHPELTDLGVPVLGSFAQAADVVQGMEVDSVAVLGCPEMDGPTLRRLSWALEGSRTDFIVAPALLDVAGPRIAIRPVCGLPLLHVEQPEFSGMRRIVKAAVDRAAAGVALLLLTPVLLAIAAAVKASSPGPVLFRQVRVGRDGSIFTILKFRTMTADAEQRLPDVMHLNANSDGLLFKIPDDPRLTRVGRVLRRYSLDELPQLLNVLAGSMSLVGPRPPLPTEVEQYHLDLHRRLLVKPGLTGLWQISGRADLSWDEAVRLDLRYVENWSLTLDLLILWKTVAVVLRGRGAY